MDSFFSGANPPTKAALYRCKGNLILIPGCHYLVWLVNYRTINHKKVYHPDIGWPLRCIYMFVCKPWYIWIHMGTICFWIGVHIPILYRYVIIPIYPCIMLSGLVPTASAASCLWGKRGCKNERLGGDSVNTDLNGGVYMCYIVHRSFKFKPPWLLDHGTYMHIYL